MNVGEVLNAIFYVLSTGCQWPALPKDLPPKSTAYNHFGPWGRDGNLERVHHTLYVAVREREGREAGPTAAVIDSQSAKAAQKGGRRTRLRLDCLQPPSRPRLRTLRQNRRLLRPPRHDPHHAPAPDQDNSLFMTLNFRDRL